MAGRGLVHSHMRDAAKLRPAAHADKILLNTNAVIDAEVAAPSIPDNTKPVDKSHIPS